MSTPSPTSTPSPKCEVSPFGGLTFSTNDDNGEQLGELASVFCYLEAEEPPKKLQILVKNGFFSFGEDGDRFLSKTDLNPDVVFEIYDGFLERFTPIPPSAYWRYPSPRSPFFIVRDGRLEDGDCGDLQNLVRLLSDAKEPKLTESQTQPSSSFPPSPPPPAQPFHRRASPTQVKPVEEEPVEVEQSAEELHPRKRKRVRSRITRECVPKAAFKLNLSLSHAYGEDCNLSENGTGESAEDPIVI